MLNPSKMFPEYFNFTMTIGVAIQLNFQVFFAYLLKTTKPSVT